MNYEVYKQIRPALVIAIRNVMVNGNPLVPTQFSGFITVRMLDTNEIIDYVKWCNPLLGDTGYGVISIPVPKRDCVSIGFDLRKKPYVTGMLTYCQALKVTLDDQKVFDVEINDPRLKINPGELMLRGSNLSDILFANDGSTTFRLNDTLQDSDPNNLVIKIGADRSITITNAGPVTVTSTGTVQVTANEVDIVSDNINLGNGAGKSPVLRVSDIVGMSVLGTPGPSILPVVFTGTGSATTKSN